MLDFPLFPPQASTFAFYIDALFFMLTGVSLFFTALICALIAFFSIRYRASAKVDRSNAITHSNVLELIWSVIPLIICMGFFYAGARLFYQINDPPPDAMEIYVIGK